MKQILLVLALLSATACSSVPKYDDADDEALEPERSPYGAPVYVTVNNNIGAPQTSMPAVPGHGGPSPTGYYFNDGTPDTRTDCKLMPVMNGFGQTIGQERQCFGSH